MHVPHVPGMDGDEVGVLNGTVTEQLVEIFCASRAGWNSLEVDRESLRSVVL